MDNYKKGRGGIRVQVPICDKQTVIELSSDFSLPDYQPPFKRLLRVRACVSPADQYIGAGNAEFSGTVDYTVLYTGNDDCLYCFSESSEYHFSVPIEMTSDIDLNDGLTCDVDVIPDMTVGRVAAPRKLSLKCRLRARVRIWGTRLIEEALCDMEQKDLQRLCGTAECGRIFVGNGEPLQLGDEILLDAGENDLRVISAEGEVFVSEATAGSGVVNCRGEVCLKLLCAHESTQTPPTVLLRRIPFSQAVITDGVEVNCDACADGCCSDIRITVEEGRILCELVIRLRARAQRNESITFTRDLYSTAAACDCTSLSCTLPLAVKCLNGNFSVGITLPLSEAGIRAGMEVVDISLIPAVTSLESEHGKYYLNGKCRALVVLSDSEESTVQELELPFRYETDGGEPIADYDASVNVISGRARLDGERISVDAELAVCLSVRGESRLDILTDARLGEPLPRTGAVCTVCYPSREDTLWSVAKRYHRSVSAISETNGLAGSPAANSPESLAGVKYLLV